MIAAIDNEPTGGNRALSARPSGPLTAAETDRVRNRVRLMVQITSRVGKYRSGLADAARRLTPSEASILADLEFHGLNVGQLREVLCGAHVLVDDPTLYERWLFPESRPRLSSHHKSIDKRKYPDIGLRGPVVREKLHGRTENGTWVQLEKTPAAFGAGIHMPNMTDLKHLLDYVQYRISKKNVGPWGLSGSTERRPMYLSPDLGVMMPLPESAERDLKAALEAIEHDDDTTSASPDLAVRFPPPQRASSLDELVFIPGQRNGQGLFGASDVYITEAPSPVAQDVLGSRNPPTAWQLPPAAHSAPKRLKIGDRVIETRVRLSSVAEPLVSA